jgi:hypothetical protein
MKHPFLTLYYTGIGIFLSGGVILTLVVINVPNITRAFTKETPTPTPKSYPESADVKVLKNIPTQEPQKSIVKEIVKATPVLSISKVENQNNITKVVKQDSTTPNSEETTASPDSSLRQQSLLKP